MEAAGLATLARPALETFTDDELCARIADGDGAAFETLFVRHQRGLLSFCRHMLRSLHEAEDVVQHTFLAAYGQLERGEGPGHCRAWLYAIARNRCLNVMRGRPQSLPVGREPQTDGLDKQVERMSDLRALLRSLERLPAEQRSAIVLFELEALSHAEIAEVLEVDQAKVKSLVFQARSTLASFRAAGEVPCAEVRRQLSSLRGGALNARGLRHHLEICAGCTSFREETRRQRAGLAVVIPVVPAVAWSKGVLAALPAGGAGAAAAASGGSGSAGAAAAASGGSGSAGAAASSALGGMSAGGGALGTVAASVALGLGILVAVDAGRDDRESPATAPPAAKAAAPPGPRIAAPQNLSAGSAPIERARTRRREKRRRPAPAAPAAREERAAPAPEPVASAPPPSPSPPLATPVAPAPVSSPPRPQGPAVEPGVRFDDSGPTGPVNYPRAEPR